MNKKQVIPTLLVWIASLALAACAANQATPTAASAEPVATLTNEPSAQMANPASENCLQQGGNLTIEKRGDGGEFGVCTFEGGLQCEEWALFNGDCPVGGREVTGYGAQGRYCMISGGEYTQTSGDAANEQGACTFKNGAKCDGADYWQGLCSSDTAAQPELIAPTAQVETMDNIYAGTMVWMDHLKTCTPYARTYMHPLLAVQQTDSIKGMEDNLCLVTQETAGKFIFECRYTSEGLKIMTQDAFYEQAKNKTPSVYGEDVNQVMSEQCAIIMLPTPAAP